MTEITQQSKEAIAFNQLQGQLKAHIDRCAPLEVKDEATLKIATTALADLKGFEKEIEAMKAKLKEPYLKAGKEIDRLAAQFSDPIEKALLKGKDKIYAYNEILRQKAAKEQERISGIKRSIENYAKTCIIAMDSCENIKDLTEVFEKHIKAFPGPEKWFELDAEAQVMRRTLKDYCSARKTQILTPDQVDEEEAPAIKEVIQEQIQEVGKEEIKQAEFSSSTAFRGTWKFELVDINAVPDDWFIVDEEKVKAFMKANKKTLEKQPLQNGFKFYLEQTIIIK